MPASIWMAQWHATNMPWHCSSGRHYKGCAGSRPCYSTATQSQKLARHDLMVPMHTRGKAVQASR